MKEKGIKIANNTTSPFSTTHQEVNKPEDQQDPFQQVLDLIPMKRPYTAKHVTLLNNEIELED